MLTSWDSRFIDLADYFAQWSKDRSTKVGAVFVRDKRVLSTGYNGFPRGINDDLNSRHARPAKYLWTEHAERNAIFNAAREGIALEGSTVYVQLFPCADCARALINCGVARLVCPEPYATIEKRGEEFAVSLEMLNESNIELEFIKDDAKNYPT